MVYFYFPGVLDALTYASNFGSLKVFRNWANDTNNEMFDNTI